MFILNVSNAALKSPHKYFAGLKPFLSVCPDNEYTLLIVKRKRKM